MMGIAPQFSIKNLCFDSSKLLTHIRFCPTAAHVLYTAPSYATASSRTRTCINAHMQARRWGGRGLQGRTLLRLSGPQQHRSSFLPSFLFNTGPPSFLPHQHRCLDPSHPCWLMFPHTLGPLGAHACKDALDLALGRNQAWFFLRVAEEEETLDFFATGFTGLSY